MNEFYCVKSIRNNKDTSHFIERKSYWFGVRIEQLGSECPDKRATSRFREYHILSLPRNLDGAFDDFEILTECERFHFDPLRELQLEERSTRIRLHIPVSESYPFDSAIHLIGKFHQRILIFEIEDKLNSENRHYLLHSHTSQKKLGVLSPCLVVLEDIFRSVSGN